MVKIAQIVDIWTPQIRMIVKEIIGIKQLEDKKTIT